MACIPPNPRRVGYIDPIHGPLDGPLYMGSHIHQQEEPSWIIITEIFLILIYIMALLLYFWINRLHCFLFQSNDSGATVVGDISDDWEFEETKVMQAQEELRSIRAKIAVLEGKMALEIMYTLKLIIYASYFISFPPTYSIILSVSSLVKGIK